MRLNILSTLLLLGAIDKVVARRVLNLDSLDVSDSDSKNEKREPKRLPLDIEGIMAGPVSYTHLDVYKRQSSSLSSPLSS